LNPTIFPAPYYNNTPEHDLEVDFAGLPIKVRAAESMLSYNLEPTVGWDRSEVIEPIELSQDSQDLAEDNSGELKQHIKEYYELAQKTKDDIANDPTAYSEVFPGMDIVMTTLGTGSSHPSKYRNGEFTVFGMRVLAKNVVKE
jgi:ribonuclease Z